MTITTTQKIIKIGTSKGVTIPAKQLHVLMNPYRAEPENGFHGVAVRFLYHPTTHISCEIQLGEEWRVRLNPQFLEGLAARAEIASFEVNY